MGLSNYLPNSRVAQPGVIPNEAARPASPYDGQVIYQQDTDRTLVWNGTAWVDVSTGKAGKPGLVFIKEQTVGTGVSSVEVTGAFSADYDNYRITYSGGSGSANTLIYLRFGSTTTGYYVNFIYTAWNSTVLGDGGTTRTSFERFGRVSTTANNNYGASDVLSPYLSANTRIVGHDVSADGAGTGFGFLNNTTSYTSFTILPASGTLTGGTIRVYGYNQ